MIKALLPIAFLAFSLFSTGQINFQDLSIDEAIEKAQSEKKRVFIDVYTTWCGPCKTLDRNVFKNPGVGDRMNPDFISIKVDAERYPDQARLKVFKVRAYPTMLILNAEGRLVKKLIGNMSVQRFLTELDAFTDPALLPQNIALKKMEESPNDEAVWRKSMAVLLEKAEMRFNEHTQTFVDRFGLDELNNELDSMIFYNSTLPLDSPIPQRILEDNEYMSWNGLKYRKLDLRERARTAPTKKKYDAVIVEAKELHNLLMIENNGDFFDEEYFLNEIFPEDLNPIHLQEKVKLTCRERRIERRKEREGRKLERQQNSMIEE